LLLASVNINEDLGYDSLDDVFGSVL